MKTLKTITLTLLFATIVTLVMADKTEIRYITTTDDLRQVIKQKVESNFADTDNFLYKKGVKRLYENVEIIFFIFDDQTIRILSIKSETVVATEYLKQLLNDEKLNVENLMTEKIYKIDLKLLYRAN